MLLIFNSMDRLKNLWTTIVGSVGSIFPLFFAFCKPGGACAVACASPIASLFGISSASLAATPLMKSLYSLLLVLSAVSFTISYYRLYILPRYNSSGCDDVCACNPEKEDRQLKLSKYIFWIGLFASIVFFSYFEYQNYKSNTEKAQVECCEGGEDEKECCSSESE